MKTRFEVKGCNAVLIIRNCLGDCHTLLHTFRLHFRKKKKKHEVKANLQSCQSFPVAKSQTVYSGCGSSKKKRSITVDTWLQTKKE